ncbi:hypothetical protein CYMTET_7568 [Cymbomonas tetramitiformis]|uniref:Uncharacterized protein n=1 Tax=Cymbomonas tetramitiformis TaxID=36881 RepID=A0AAE0GUW7_9CHLO|nr:hypothetical protein CYMTET_7568 [Cymbomonas tetramitiformis]
MSVYSPEGDTGCFAERMPAARGRSDFIDVMGVPVGEADKVDMEMLKKVEELCAILPTMVKCEAAGEHARRMLEALVDLLPEGGLPWHSLEFAALPHGMGLTKATRVSGAAWLGGFAQVWEDMRELFPMVTGGIGDLEAESNLPYVRSLQAAMQKVCEAMEEIEGARVADKYLPPRVPKADDVKKLSDYRRSQKHAQRVYYAAVLHSADWLRLAGRVRQPRLLWPFLVTFNSIGPAFFRGIHSCPALEPSSTEYRVTVHHVLHAEQPLLGRMGECHDCGDGLDPTGTHLMACRGGVGAGGGNRYSFIHHKLQRVLFDVAKSAFPLASALHDDFAGYLTYSPNHCPDVTVLGAEGPGRHVMFNVAPAHPMAEAHSGAAMMAPGAAAKREESKVATYGNVGKHQLMPVGVQEEVDEGEDMGEDEEGEGPLGCSMGWKQRGGVRPGLAGAGPVAVFWMEGVGPVLFVASEHGGGPRGSPLESGATPARALELAVQGVAGMARASGRVSRLVEVGEGEHGEGFRSGGMGMGGGARPDSFPFQDIWQDERASGWQREDDEAGCDQWEQGEPGWQREDDEAGCDPGSRWVGEEDDEAGCDQGNGGGGGR